MAASCESFCANTKSPGIASPWQSAMLLRIRRQPNIKSLPRGALLKCLYLACILLLLLLFVVVCFLQSASESAMDMDEAVRLVQVLMRIIIDF